MSSPVLSGSVHFSEVCETGKNTSKGRKEYKKYVYIHNVCLINAKKKKKKKTRESKIFIDVQVYTKRDIILHLYEDCLVIILI